MQASAWLVVSRKGIQRMAKNKPTLDAEELAVAVTVTIPDGLFQRPTIAAHVVVDDIDSLPVITSETRINLEEQLRVALGLDVSVDVREAENGHD